MQLEGLQTLSATSHSAARRDGDRIQFDAETERAQWGRLQWHGMMTGHRLDGTLTMVRDGATAGEKWVVAGER